MMNSIYEKIAESSKGDVEVESHGEPEKSEKSRNGLIRTVAAIGMAAVMSVAALGVSPDAAAADFKSFEIDRISMNSNGDVVGYAFSGDMPEFDDKMCKIVDGITNENVNAVVKGMAARHGMDMFEEVKFSNKLNFMVKVGCNENVADNFKPAPTQATASNNSPGM